MSTKVKAASETASDEMSNSSFFRRIESVLRENQQRYCSSETWIPPTDVYETESHVVIRMEIAGVAESDFRVTVAENVIHVQGGRRDLDPSPKVGYHLMEIPYGRFHRMFRFPAGMHLGEVRATLSGGFLLIEVPKDPNAGEYRISVD